MKKFILILFIFSLSINAFSQIAPPNGFNYSAVVRDASGSLVANQAIAIQLSVIVNSPSGQTLYEENHNVLTDNFGLVNLIIGTGSIQQGNFSSIDWYSDNFFLKIGMDLTGGTNFTTMGTTQFLSVPYAMHSKTADSVLNNVTQILSISNDTIYLSGGSFAVLPIDFDKDNTNEIQFLSMSNDTLFLSNGGFTVLPTDLDKDTTNEIQFLSLSNDTLFLSNGGFTVLPTDLDKDTTNEIQTLTIKHDTLFLSNGGFTVLPTDLDKDTTNEIQTLTIKNDTLFLSKSGFVLLPKDSSVATNVGLGTNAPLPTLTTTSLANITGNTAKCGGFISHDGGTAVIERGVCWKTTSSPTISNNRAIAFGGGTGNYEVNISGLQTSTTYYLKAYAINNSGISYGNEISFNTGSQYGALGAVLLPNNGYCSNDTISVSSCNNIDSIIYNGYTYELVEIGGQCWFKENLQTTQLNNGFPLSLGFNSTNTSSYSWHNNNSSTANTYGAYYNSIAINSNRICPAGWHVPTDCDWMYLENSLGLSDADQILSNQSRGNNQGGFLKSIGFWASPNTWANNNSGFSALPAGNRENNNTFSLTSEAYFGTQNGPLRRLSKFNGQIYRGGSGATYIHYSIRCIKD